jgi:hypothetical protein
VHLRSGVGGREEVRADLGGKETEDQEVEQLDELADRAGEDRSPANERRRKPWRR